MMEDKILKDIASISETEGKRKRLLLVAHEGKEVYDFREWNEAGDPLDGVILTEEELKRLGAAIKAATLYGGKHGRG